MIDWNKVTKESIEGITKILERANKTESISVKRILARGEDSLRMDLEATSLVVDLDWKAWLEADEFNFLHDLIGIYNHLNRETGKLDNCFLPRFAKCEKT